MYSITAQLQLTAVEKTLFSPFVLWPLNLNECCERSQRQPLPLRRPVSKNKTTPLSETANYSVWPLLKYLMIFTSRQKCPGVIELPPWTFIGVTAASPTTRDREVKQAAIVCDAGASESERAWFSKWGCESMLSCTSVCCGGFSENTNILRHDIATRGKMVRCGHTWAPNTEEFNLEFCGTIGDFFNQVSSKKIQNALQGMLG